jgi:TolB protein
MPTNDRLTWRAAAWAVAVTLSLAGCDSTEPRPTDPPGTQPPETDLRLEAQSDTVLAGTVGTRLASVPVVRLTANGKPAPGREVRFSASSGGWVAVSMQRTDTAGLASPGAWTLATEPTPQTLTVHAAGSADLVFTAVVSPGPAATLDIISGDHQTAAVGAAVSTPLQIRLADKYGNLISGEPVTFKVIVGNGAIAGDSQRTDAHGIASSGIWTLGDVGAQLVKVSAGGKEAFVEALACGDPCRGRDFLFSRDYQLYSSINGVTTSLFIGAFEPAWSPDGQRIAFGVYNYSDDDIDLYVMDADGSNATVRGYGLHAPSWAPDGQRIAVTGYDGIYVLDLTRDDTPPALLVKDGGSPAWSPDGTKIAFVVSSDSSLRIMNADGSAVTTLLGGGTGFVSAPAWSPDGQYLVFSKCDVSECGMFTMLSSGADLVQLTPMSEAYPPKWSPDGSRIAFTSPAGVAWIPVRGSISSPVLMIPEGDNFAWRP